MKIEHKYAPGFVMEVLNQRPCESDGGEEHLAYQVVDPEGVTDWICAHDTKIVED